MIRVGEDELRAQLFQRFVPQPFDRGLRADGHKDGRFDGTVRSREHTAAGAGAVGLQHLEGEAHLSSVSGEDKCKSRPNELPHGPNNECDSDGAPRFQFTWIESSKPDSNQNKDQKVTRSMPVPRVTSHLAVPSGKKDPRLVATGFSTSTVPGGFRYKTRMKRRLLRMETTNACETMPNDTLKFALAPPRRLKAPSMTPPTISVMRTGPRSAKQ